MSNSVVEHLLYGHEVMRTERSIPLTTDRLIANNEHVEYRVPVGVLHVRISPMIDEIIIDGSMTKGSSQCQWIFTVVGMR